MINNSLTGFLRQDEEKKIWAPWKINMHYSITLTKLHKAVWAPIKLLLMLNCQWSLCLLMSPSICSVIVGFLSYGVLWVIYWRDAEHRCACGLIPPGFWCRGQGEQSLLQDQNLQLQVLNPHLGDHQHLQEPQAEAQWLSCSCTKIKNK